MKTLRIAVVAVVVLTAVAVFVANRPAPLPPSGAQAPAGGAAAAGRAPAAAAPSRVALIVVAPADDQTIPNPCARIANGGLITLRAFVDAASESVPKETPSLAAFLGDVTHARGNLGREISAYHWNEVLSQAEIRVAGVGPAELALGTEFSRRALAPLPFRTLCANAADQAGNPILNGWAIGDAGACIVLLVSTVSTDRQDMLRDAKSDVRLLPADESARRALADAEAEAKSFERPVGARVLFHHGTAEETARILQAAPGFSVAFATLGADLPDQEPRFAGDVPVYTTGRDLRFGWIVVMENGRVQRATLGRLGIQVLTRGSPTAGEIGAFSEILRDRIMPALVGPPDQRDPDPRGSYVGSARCAQCHADEVAAHSGSRHRGLPAKFPETGLGRYQCLVCHVTAATHSTGWSGRDDTTDFTGVSCESCHGPGAAHSDDPKAGWGRFELSGCRSCHTPDRSPDFDAEALWKKWGHGPR